MKQPFFFFLAIILAVIPSDPVLAEEIAQTAWVRKGPKFESNGLERKPTALEIDMGDNSIGSTSDKGKNTITWSVPPAVLHEGDTVTLTMDSTSTPGPPMQGTWQIEDCTNSANVIKFNNGVGSLPNYKRESPTHSDMIFKFVPKFVPTIAVGAGRYDDYTGNMNVKVTWTYEEEKAPAASKPPQAEPAIEEKKELSPVTVKAAASSDHYKVGDTVTITGKVTASSLPLSSGIKAAIEVLSGAHNSAVGGAMLASGATDDHGNFRIDAVIPADGMFDMSSTTWTVIAKPYDSKKYDKGMAEVNFSVETEGPLTITVLTDKAVYSPQDSVKVAGDVTVNSTTQTVAGARVQIASGQSNALPMPIASAVTNTQGHYETTFPVIRMVPENPAATLGRQIHEGHYMIIVMPDAKGFDHGLGAKTYFAVQEDASECALQEFEVFQVLGKPKLSHSPEKLSSPFSENTLQRGTKLTEGTVFKTFSNSQDEVTVGFQFQNGAQVIMVVKPNSQIRIGRFCKGKDGKVKLRVFASSPSQIKILTKNPDASGVPLDYQIVTASSIITSVHTSYTVSIDAEGVTTITSEEEEVSVIPLNPNLAPVVVKPGETIHVSKNEVSGQKQGGTAFEQRIRNLFNSPQYADDLAFDTFASISLVIARYHLPDSCYQNDPYVNHPTWDGHRQWSIEHGRNRSGENVIWKTGGALACLPDGSEEKNRLIADIEKIVMQAETGKVARVPDLPAGGPAPAGPAASGSGLGISVLSATYGQNCGVAAGNVTSQAQQACNGNNACDYGVDATVLGDPAYGCAKDYIITWRCGGSTAQHTITLVGEAGWPPQTAKVSCPPPKEAVTAIIDLKSPPVEESAPGQLAASNQPSAGPIAPALDSQPYTEPVVPTSGSQTSAGPGDSAPSLIPPSPALGASPPGPSPGMPPSPPIPSSAIQPTSFLTTPEAQMQRRNQYMQSAGANSTETNMNSLVLTVSNTFQSTTISDPVMMDFFAAVSVHIARRNLPGSCYGNDPYINDPRWDAHRAVAAQNSRDFLRQRLVPTIDAAMRCLNKPAQDNLYADIAEAMAQAWNGQVLRVPDGKRND